MNNTNSLLKRGIRRLAVKGVFDWMPDKPYLKLKYWACLGKRLNIKQPTTYNEKLQWLKLYDRRPIYNIMVDKCEAKKYVAERIGEEYIIPTLGVWDRFEDISFDSLPEKFVLKCTHDSGGLVICRNKALFDIEAAKKIINRSMKRNYYFQSREWPYKDVRPRIIAEQYMEDASTAELRDYKIFCFDGVAKALFVASERQDKEKETKFDFFDTHYNHLPFINGHPNAVITPSKPKTLELMLKLAEKLSEGYPHIRVDFYEVNGRTYFGELTLSHWSGFTPFEPPEWDRIFGDWLVLP